MIRSKAFLLSGAALMALSVAACTSQQIQAIENDITVACSILPIGAAIVVEVVSSVPALAAGGTVVQAIGNEAGSVCTSVLSDIESIISKITAANGTATVTISSTTAAGVAKLHGIGLRMASKYKGVVMASAKGIVIVVPPNQPFDF